MKDVNEIEDDPIPTGPPEPSDPADSGPTIFAQDRIRINDQPERNCLIRMGFLDGQVVEAKTFTFGYFTSTAKNGGRIVVEHHKSKYRMWFGVGVWGGDLLVETFSADYTCYNPWSCAPSFGFQPLDSDGKRLIDEPITAGIGGRCPSYSGVSRGCGSLSYYNKLSPLQVFSLAADAQAFITRGTFRYC